MTKPSASDSYIDVRDLRVGMFIHLDLGWMSHPFPLSSFKLSAPDQIETLHSLGLSRVRWAPHRSEIEEPAAAAQTEPPRPAPEGPAAATAPAGDPAEEARQAHRARLAAEREALQLCERQLAEASHECRELFEHAGSDPIGARTRSEALVGAFLDKMLVADHDLSIRLLTTQAGDKAAQHALNVAIVSLLMGRVFGLGRDDMRDLGVGALLHDIGKATVPERLRHASEHLSPYEFKGYEAHVAEGVAEGRRMGLAPGALLVIGQHHEHADGSGFPQGVGSDRMSFAARIVALVNRYDNLCNPHVASKALTPHEALSLLFAQGKTRYDTAILGAFIKMMGVYPPGSAVQLTDDRYALVTSANSSRPLKPRILVYDPKVPREEALLLDLQGLPGLGIRRALRVQALPRPVFDYLGPKPATVYFFEASAAAHASVEPLAEAA